MPDSTLRDDGLALGLPASLQLTVSALGALLAFGEVVGAVLVPEDWGPSGSMRAVPVLEEVLRSSLVRERARQALLHLCVSRPDQGNRHPGGSQLW